MINRTTVIRRFFDVLGAILVVVSVLSLLYYWDPTRIYVKHFKADSPYKYDEIRPQFLTADPASFVDINGVAERDQARNDLIRTIWGEAGIPFSKLPDHITKDIQAAGQDTSECVKLESSDTYLRLKCQLDRYEDWDHLAGIDELRTDIGPVYTASIAYFRPKLPNGTLVIYQNGYASTYHHQYRHIERLTEAGYTVAAANHIGYGDNFCPKDNQELIQWCDIGWGRFEKPLPMRVHFTPLITAINYAREVDALEQVAIIGLSAGGWLSSVIAAVDTRIKFSYPVAGFMPPFLQGEGESPPNQQYGPLFEAASMLDHFILGATGTGRRQIQFFNRYDRCCYANTRALLYETTIAGRVAKLGDGHFDVRIDETHARHKISRWTMDAILQDLAEHSPQ